MNLQEMKLKEMSDRLDTLEKGTPEHTELLHKMSCGFRTLIPSELNEVEKLRLENVELKQRITKLENQKKGLK